MGCCPDRGQSSPHSGAGLADLGPGAFHEFCLDTSARLSLGSPPALLHIAELAQGCMSAYRTCSLPGGLRGPGEPKDDFVNENTEAHRGEILLYDF